jgi:MFS family permease
LTKEETLPPTRAEKPGIFYGYIVVAAGFSIMTLVHGAFNSFGVFFTPLLDEFGPTRALLSGASSLAFLVMGFMSVVMGLLTDRFGPRKVITASALFFGAGHILMSQAGNIWQIYLFFIVIGIGLSASDVVPLSTVVRWFIRKRGAMTGIMKVGTGLGMVAVPPLTITLIGAFGWKTSYLILGVVIMAAVIPLAQLMRRDPREMGLLPDGAQQTTTGNPVLSEPGLSVREALRTRQLWMVCSFYIAILYCGMTVLVHIVPHALDMGTSAGIAASFVSTIGGTSIVGRLTMGFTGDKIGHKRGIVVCFVVLVTALSWLQFASELWMLYLFAAIYGFNHGGFFALISPTIADLFGTRSQGTLLGIVILFGTLGGSLGSVLAGHIFDTTGSYQLAFFILLMLAITGLILAILIKPIRKGGTE